METNNKTKEVETALVDVEALAATIALDALRCETKGECDKVDPNSIQGQEYSRLAHNLKELYTEIIRVHKVD